MLTGLLSRFVLAGQEAVAELAASTPLPEWEAFYVIIGTSAAALTGLQFVVITLLLEEKPRDAARAIAAFATPTVVHFSAVLLVSGILSAPWKTNAGPAGALGLCGIAGIAYTILTFARVRRQRAYAPVFEDWLWHVVLPLLAYAAIGTAALGMRGDPERSLFFIAGAVLVVLFAAIHNAWDTVTFLAERRSRPASEEPAQPTSTEAR